MARTASVRPVRFRASLMLTAVLLCGCDLEAQIAPRLAGQISEIREQTAEMKVRLDAIAKSVDELRAKQANRELEDLVASFEQVAYLKPGNSGYSLVRFDLGVLTIELADVKPYANGSKVTLKFGNVLAASVNGLKATVEWGKLDDKGFPVEEAGKSKKITLTETLRTGAWTSVSVVLEGLPATELGFVRVKEVAHSGIALTGK